MEKLTGIMCFLRLQGTAAWMNFFEEFGLLPSHDNLLYDDPAEFQVKRITARTLTEAEVVEQAAGQMEDDILDNWDCEKIVDPEIRAELEKRFWICISL